jgi:hypothetical protein
MSRMTNGRIGWCVGLAVVVFGPALAQAQLFPNLPIKRQRPSLDEEAPVYGTYRRQYYGYYPTCWRRYPAGWGCPTPEAVDWNTIQREDPVRMRRELEAVLPRPAAGAGGGAGEGGAGVPAVPGPTVSPFEVDGPAPAGGAAPAPAPGAGTAPAPGAAPAPAPAVPPAGGARSPFELGPGQAGVVPRAGVTPVGSRAESARGGSRAGRAAGFVEVSLNEDGSRRRR